MKLLLLFLILAAVKAESCGGNCPSGTCTSCPCGYNTNMIDIAQWCSKHTWNQNCCKCIVSHESQGNANFMNFNKYGAFTVGLLQIQQVFWHNCNNSQPPCSPESNLKCAAMAYEFYENSWIGWDSYKACGCK